MRYAPLHARIIVDPIDTPRTTAGGILIPDAAKDWRGCAFGRVVAVGRGRVNAQGVVVPLQVVAGDVVVYPSKRAIDLPLIGDDGKETKAFFIEEADLVATVHEMPVDTGLTDLSGKSLLAMRPVSIGRPDVAYKNIDELDRAKANGWDDDGAVDES